MTKTTKKPNKKTQSSSPTVPSPFSHGCWPISNRLPDNDNKDNHGDINTDGRHDDGSAAVAAAAGVFLKPGNVLSKCNGSDIQMSKTSHVAPNFVTGRGRFLFLLPGLLSLQRPLNEQEDTSNGTTSDAAAGGGGGGANGNNAQDTKLDALVTNKSSGMYTLGKVKKLDTEEPTLELYLGDEKNGGKRLVWKGKKVKTCGRYLVLSCKTSGTVNCRNIFEELVVFGGDYQVKGEEGESASGNLSNGQKFENGKQIEHEVENINNEDDNSVTVVIEEEIMKEDSQDLQRNMETKEELFYHYGGSERAVDGGRPVRGIKRKSSIGNVSRRSSTGMDSSRSFTQESQEESQQEEQDNEKERKEEGKGGGKTKRKSTGSLPQQDKSHVLDLDSEEDNYYKEEEQGEGEDDDDDDGDDRDDDFEMNSPVPSTPRARYVRRSATKQVKYTFDEEEEEEEQEEEEEGQKPESEEESIIDIDNDDNHYNSQEESSLEESGSTKRPRQKTKRNTISIGTQQDKGANGDNSVKRGQRTKGNIRSSVSGTTRKRLPKTKKDEETKAISSTSSPSLRKRRKSPKKSSSASKSLDIMMKDDEEFIFVE